MKSSIKIIVSSGFLFFSLLISAQDFMFIPFGSEWKYLDTGVDLGTDWRASTFDDSGWASGPAELGYGDNDENTVISFGNDSENKHITTYFRHSFEISNVSNYVNFLLKLKRDDGALLYVNGEEVMRSNFRTDTYYFDDFSDAAISSNAENIIFEEIIPASFFQNGINHVAVEIHQSSLTSADLSFDFELIGLDANPSLYHEPYLQIATPTSIVLKWVTDVPSKSKVKYGNAPGSLTDSVELSNLTANHEVTVSNLQPDKKYYYSVGSDSEEFAGGEETYYFTTHPEPGNVKPIRIWAIGDSGRGTQDQKDVRDSYINYIGQEKADVWLMLGDNAYYHGRGSEYHAGLFKDMYEPILRNTTLWPIAGNHDYYSGADASAQTGTYYESFALPKNGETGGVASGTEAFYSFDFGNIHFIGLDSYDVNRDSTAAMGQWLKQDLENTDADWLIAYWHYPPYTKGNHDSDESETCIEMRENFNPILERYGVDLVLCGHSHVYERSFLLNGHYGLSNTLDGSMIVDSSSGKLDLSEPYTKPASLTANAGTVYAVCGVAGRLAELEGAHPAMYFDTDQHLGSMIIDIYEDTLEAKFINSEGKIIDYFHIIKDASTAIQNTTIPNSNFKIYPNPATDLFSVSYFDEFSNTKNIQIQLYATDGSMLLQKRLESISKDAFSSQIDTRELPSGIYTIKLMVDEKLISSNLLVIGHK